MNRKLLIAVSIFSLSLMASAAFAEPTITVYTTLAPNIDGSPSYDGWRDNAIYALEHGLSSYGTPGTPEYYQETDGITPYNLPEVTSFNSWMGQADPGAVFGAAFANELGERAADPLFINGNGTQFSISQLSFTDVGSDPDNSLGFGFAAGSYGYSADYVGILAGPDGLVGTSDDIYITSGANTQLVDALVGRGSGNGLWPCDPGVDLSPCSTVADQQADIDSTMQVLAGTTLTGTYSLGNVSGSATFDFVTPEPTTWLLTGIALVSLLVTAQRKRKA